ncbi:MAG: dihydrofolate reductase family protein [Gemmatimonadota bacterium]|nr:dihydrofolate reductase family protein [Gemmatimonadota bacterium]
MKRVILQEFVSVDGLAAGPNDSVDYVPASMRGDKRFGQRQINFLDSVDTILLGRVTYEGFAGYWPNVTTGDDEPFADKLNAMPKVVVSTTLKSAPWGKWGDAKIVKDTKQVATLREGSGKGIVVWGSLSLAQSLMKNGLVDEYQLIVCPIVLGTGRPLFSAKTPSFDLELVETQSFDRGAVLLTYKGR